MMAAALTMGLAACGSSASTDTAASTADTAASGSEAAADSTAAADGKVYNVGICQLVQHEALDAATQGFKDAFDREAGRGQRQV